MTRPRAEVDRRENDSRLCQSETYNYLSDSLRHNREETQCPRTTYMSHVNESNPLLREGEGTIRAFQLKINSDMASNMIFFKDR